MVEPGITSLTVRVYGVLIARDALLLSREVIQGQIYTKFPGGGLELGESTIDCLVREFQEEADILVEPLHHLYTTEGFVRSAFDPSVQVLSIYYRIASSRHDAIQTLDRNQLDQPSVRSDQIFFWQPLSDLRHENLNLPIDRIVVDRVLNDRHR